MARTYSPFLSEDCTVRKSNILDSVRNLAELQHSSSLRPMGPNGQSPVWLTARELAVAELAYLPNAEIARVLGISVNTVKAHLSNIFRKTGFETRGAIAVWADRLTRRAA